MNACFAEVPTQTTKSFDIWLTTLPITQTENGLTYVVSALLLLLHNTSSLQ